MNSDQFQALAQLLRLRQGPQREAARLVLVDGVRQADAARMAGCSASALGNTLRACRAGLELARLAAGGSWLLSPWLCHGGVRKCIPLANGVDNS